MFQFPDVRFDAFRFQNPDSRLQFLDFRFQISVLRFRISDFKLQNSDSGLQIDDSSSNAFSTLHHSSVGMYLRTSYTLN